MCVFLCVCEDAGKAWDTDDSMHKIRQPREFRASSENTCITSFSQLACSPEGTSMPQALKQTSSAHANRSHKHAQACKPKAAYPNATVSTRHHLPPQTHPPLHSPNTKTCCLHNEHIHQLLTCTGSLRLPLTLYTHTTHSRQQPDIATLLAGTAKQAQEGKTSPKKQENCMFPDALL
jgi:hypothetical protein